LSGSRTRRSGYVVSVLILIIAALAVGLPGWASDGGMSDPDVGDDAVLRDAARFAASGEVLFPELWAGSWLDIDSDEVVLAFATTDLSAVGGQVEALAEAPGSLRLESVEYSMRELKAEFDAVVVRMDQLREQGIVIHWSGIDVRRNAVAVALDEITPEAVQAIGNSDLIEMQESEPIIAAQVPIQTCASREACVPEMRGGVRLIGPSGYTCTSGFEAKKVSIPLLLTAGHCYRLNENITHNGVLLGPVRYRRFPDGGTGDTDAAAVDQNPNLWKSTNYVYATESDRLRPIRSIKSATAEYVNEYLCKAGVTTGYTCGRILNTGVTVNMHDEQGNFVATLTGQTFTSVCAEPGDSGSPVFYASTAYGLVSGGGVPCGNANARMSYTPIQRVQSRLGVTVRTTYP